MDSLSYIVSINICPGHFFRWGIWLDATLLWASIATSCSSGVGKNVHKHKEVAFDLDKMAFVMQTKLFLVSMAFERCVVLGLIQYNLQQSVDFIQYMGSQILCSS